MKVIFPKVASLSEMRSEGLDMLSRCGSCHVVIIDIEQFKTNNFIIILVILGMNGTLESSLHTSLIK